MVARLHGCLRRVVVLHGAMYGDVGVLPPKGHAGSHFAVVVLSHSPVLLISSIFRPYQHRDTCPPWMSSRQSRPTCSK